MKGFNKFGLNKTKWLLIGIAVILVIGVAVGLIVKKKFFDKKTETAVVDNLPVILIDDGNVAVYRELKITGSKLENQIVVSRLSGEDQKAIKIYEFIPKEIAEKASDLEFNIQPEILEDDPLIMWDLGPLTEEEPVQLKYTIKPRMERTLCVEKNYFAEMRDKYNLNAYYFDDCTKFLEIKFNEAVERNKRLREEREKEKVELINNQDPRYNEIQQQAKNIIQQISPEPAEASTKKSEVHARPKMTNEEAVATVKSSQYGGELQGGKTYDNKESECSAAWNAESGYYRVICNRENWYLGGNKNSDFYYFSFTFYTVDKDGEVLKKGNYVQKRDAKRAEKTLGKPMWGVQ